LDVVQSEEEPNLTLFRYEQGNNMMIYDRKIDYVFINIPNIWSFLEEDFGLDYDEVQEIMKVWLSEVYNLRGITPESDFGKKRSFVV